MKKFSYPVVNFGLKCSILGEIRKSFFQEVIFRKGDEDFTYLSSIEACFRNRRFPVEIIRPDRYMKIKSKHFG